jgi:hypothetical protein
MDWMIYSYQDPQSDPAIAFCNLCGCEIYEDDTVYLIDDVPVCEDCLGMFAAEYFSAQRMQGRYLAQCCAPEEI